MNDDRIAQMLNFLEPNIIQSTDGYPPGTQYAISHIKKSTTNVLVHRSFTDWPLRIVANVTVFCKWTRPIFYLKKILSPSI